MRRPASFTRLTGVTPEQFLELLSHIEPRRNLAHYASLLRPTRIRAVGGGNQFKLQGEERLLCTLLYLRQYLTMHVLGILFDLDEANICRNIHTYLPLLEQALPAPRRPRTLQTKPDELPKKGTKKPRKIRSIEEFLEVFPELTDLIVDGTEQPRGQPKVKKVKTPSQKPVGRPKDKKRYYSVKKGTHTLKVQVAVTPQGEIMHLSATARGRVHDMKLLRKSRLVKHVHPGVRLWGDRGYTGLDKIYPEHETIVPKKRPKGGDLTTEERELNRQISKVRIAAENAICRMKKFRSCKEFFRNRDKHHGLIWGCVAGLVNLRWKAQQQTQMA